MSRRAKISTFPPAVVAELNQRLADDAYGNLTETSEWLSEQGYPLGKSAVGAYAAALRRRQALVDAVHMDNGALLDAARLKLSAAAVAASTGARGNDLFALAEELVSWATRQTV